MKHFSWLRLSKRGSSKPTFISPFYRGESGVGLAIDGCKYIPSGAPAKQMKESLGLISAMLGEFAPMMVADAAADDPEIAELLEHIGTVASMMGVKAASK
jgi:hypothetical protein